MSWSDTSLMFIILDIKSTQLRAENSACSRQIPLKWPAPCGCEADAVGSRSRTFPASPRPGGESGWKETDDRVPMGVLYSVNILGSPSRTCGGSQPQLPVNKAECHRFRRSPLHGHLMESGRLAPHAPAIISMASNRLYNRHLNRRHYIVLPSRFSAILWQIVPTYGKFDNSRRCCSRASVASRSTRVFMTSPEWPRTQRQSTGVAPLRLQQALPEVHVGHRIAGRVAPVAPHPAGVPAGDAVAHVFAVGVHHDPAGPRQRLQRRRRGGQFHAVVGGRWLRAATAPVRVPSKHSTRRPAARPRVGLAAAVGPDLDAPARPRCQSP